MAWRWPWRKKKEAAEFDVEAQIEKEYSKSLLKGVESLARKVGASTKEEKEYRPMPRMEREEIATRLNVMFRELKKLDMMQRIEIKQMIDAMKSVMDPEARKDLDFDLKIEKRLESQSINLEIFLDDMLVHFMKTGDRRYVYNFMRTAAKVLKGEIKAEEKKRKIRKAA